MMSNKTIELTSGCMIHRESLKGRDEQWVVENKSLSTCEVILGLTQCKNVTVEGYEDEEEVIASAGPMQTTILFVIRKSPPFSFRFDLSFREIPMPLKDQNRYISPVNKNTVNEISDLGDQVSQMPFEVMYPEDIEEELKELGFNQFVDPAFPPDDTSIYDVTSSKEYPLNEKPVWKRPHEFMNGRPQLFEDGIEPNDIIQGVLANGWFLAAVAALSEYPPLIKRLFITKEYNKFGMYKLKICKNGEWITVIIDDYFPGYINGGPMFSSSNGNELWVLLLEKAYAKLHGNYDQLRAGFVSHGMMDLSGCPTQSYTFPAERHDFKAISSFAEDFWNTIYEADKANGIMGACTPGVDVYTDKVVSREDIQIVPGHAYTVIAADQYKDIRLLKVRNPWGDTEWKGKWSDSDKKSWTPQLIKYFKPDFNPEDGTFWISYEDFFKNFMSLCICKVDNWNELRVKGKFVKAVGIEKGDETVISQFYYSLYVKEKTYVEVGIHQEDDRGLGAEKRPYLDISYIILRALSNESLELVGYCESSTERDIEQGFELTPGHYIVVPRTTGGYLLNTKSKGESVPIQITIHGK